MFDLDETRYVITKITRTYKGRLTITKETIVNQSATCLDVLQILAQPERNEGDRAEALQELKETGITVYNNQMIEAV